MSAARKRSKQRDCIQRFLETRRDHPTAEMVYQNIREEIPNISLATVYRNLSLLAEMGEIRKIPTEEGPDRFDPVTLPHDHFFCRECGCLMDLQNSRMPRMIKEVQKEFGGQIDDQRTYFYGLCPDCLNDQKPA